jgi:DNA-binding SARP family transcriptional activator
MLGQWHAQLAQALTEPSTMPCIFIIHPHVPQPHRALQALPDDAHYLRFDGAKLEVNALEQQFSAALGDKELKADAVIILDEADRADDKALASFVVDSLLTLLAQPRIVILTRSVPLALLRDRRVNGYIQFVPSDDGMLTDYTKPPKAEHRLEVWAFGRGDALINGEAVTSWDGLLPRMLFYFLVDRGMVIRPDIFMTFWQGLAAKEATNVFHVTKRKINELLKVDLTIYESSFYRISPKIELCYDVALFKQYLQESEVAMGAARRELLLKAVGLYRAPVLYQLHYDWAQQRRAELTEAYADALMGLGELAAAGGAAAEAFNWYLRAFQQQQGRGEVVAHILRLGKELGYIENAKAVYHQHLAALDGAPLLAGLAELYDALG